MWVAYNISKLSRAYLCGSYSFCCCCSCCSQTCLWSSCCCSCLYSVISCRCSGSRSTSPQVSRYNVTTVLIAIKTLQVDRYINYICKSEFYHIRALRHIRSTITEDTTFLRQCGQGLKPSPLGSWAPGLTTPILCFLTPHRNKKAQLTQREARDSFGI